MGKFMYLRLEYVTRDNPGDKDPRHHEIFGEGLWAVITNEGTTPRPPSSLGGANSRWTNSPLGVFQLSGFDGIECIETDDLTAELLRRMTVEELMKHLSYKIPTERLVELLRGRAGLPEVPEQRDQRRAW